MSEEYGIETYSKLDEAAEHHLHESIFHIDEAMKYLLASELFSKCLEKVEVNDEDRKMLAGYVIPEHDYELLRHNDQERITDATMLRIGLLWEFAQAVASKETHKFEQSQKLCVQDDFLSHITDLAHLVETLINRHLLFLAHTNIITKSEYNKKESGKSREILNYILQYHDHQISTSNIDLLFKRRNKSLHRTPKNAKLFEMKLCELSELWIEISTLLELFESQEKFITTKYSAELRSFQKAFEDRWVKK